MKNFGLKGHFDIVKKKADGSIVEQYSFENLILDSGLDLVAIHEDNVLNYCHLGAGNSTPNVSQTSLDRHLASASKSGYEKLAFDLTTDEKSLTFVKKVIFGAGNATGNIAEIGMSNSNKNDSNNPLFCRTLIKDSQGRPTVISKLADEILEVFYTLKIIINHQDVTGVGLIDGVEYDYILRPSLVSRQVDSVFSTENIASITASPRTHLIKESRHKQAYEMQSHQLFYTVSVGLNEMTVPVRSAVFQGIFGIRWQCQFNKKSDGSAIPKDNTKTLSLKFKVSWGRA